MLLPSPKNCQNLAQKNVKKQPQNDTPFSENAYNIRSLSEREI